MSHFQQNRFLYLFFLVAIGFGITNCTNEPNLEEGYKPDHPIEFPHDIHVSKGIDCKYCHNSEINEKKEAIPDASICMKCHKQINWNPSKENEN